MECWRLSPARERPPGQPNWQREPVKGGGKMLPAGVSASVRAETLNSALASGISDSRVQDCSPTATWRATLAEEAIADTILFENVTKPCQRLTKPQAPRP